MRHALTRTWQITFAALTIAAAVFAGVVAAAPPAAAATVDGPGIDLPAGPKLRAHGITVEHMGLLVLDGRAGICIDYGLNAPTGGGFVTAATGDPKIAYIAAKWAATASNEQAAAANGAINWLVGNAEFRSDWLSTYVPRMGGPRGRVPAWASAMVAEAGRLAGPYTLAVRNTVNAPVGERSRYAVQLRSRAGVGVPSVGLSYAGSVNMRGVLLPAYTDAAGNATVDVAVLAPGVATLHVAAVNVLPWSTVLMAASQPGRQRLVAGSPRVTVRGSGSQRTDFRTVAPVVRMDCTFQCQGRPPMELGGTVPAGGVPVRFAASDSVSSVDVATVQINPGTSNRTAFVGRDGQVLRIFRQDYVNRQWTPRRLVLTYEVRCPPAATIEVQLAIACDGGITGSVTDVNDTRYEHRMVVVLPGGARVPWTIAAGTRGVSPALAWRGSITVLNTSWLAGVQVGGIDTVATVGVTTPASSRVRITRVKVCGPK